MKHITTQVIPTSNGLARVVIELDINLDRLAYHLGKRAMANKSWKTQLMGSIVKARINTADGV